MNEEFFITCNRNYDPPLGVTHMLWLRVLAGQLIHATGCISLCDSFENVVEGSCSIRQTLLPNCITHFNISVTTYFNHSSVWDFNPCSYAFVVEEDNYTSSSRVREIFDPCSYAFHTRDLRNFGDRHEKTPMVLNLAIGDLNCSEAMKDIRSYACKNNSVSQDSNNGPGHRCNCSEGFKGNHYHPQGSQGNIWSISFSYI